MEHILFGLILVAVFAILYVAGRWNTGDLDLYFGAGPPPDWVKKLAEQDKQDPPEK